MHYDKEKSLNRLKISEEELLHWRSIGYIKYSSKTDKYDIDSVFEMRTLTIGLDKILTNEQQHNIYNLMIKQSSLQRRIFSDLQHNRAVSANEYDKIGQKEYGLMSYYGLSAYQFAVGQFNSMKTWYTKTIENLENKIITKRQELNDARIHNNDFKPNFFKDKKKQLHFLENKLAKYQSKGYLSTWFGNKFINDEEKYRKSRLSLVISGEELHKGNRYIRVEEDNGKYFLKLLKDIIPIKIPHSHMNTFSTKRQTVRICYNNAGKLILNITYSFLKPISKNLIEKSKGVIGIDIGPKEIAVALVKNDGNSLQYMHFSIGNLLDKRSKETEREISIICDKIITQSLHNKMYTIVLENLQFKPDHTYKSKKLNRMLSKFPRALFLKILSGKAVRNGISIKLVNPAYTSIIGLFKYASIENLNTSHNSKSHDLSAALAIGRRGLGLKEKAKISIKLFGKIITISIKSLLVALEDVTSKFSRKSQTNSNWSLWSMLKKQFKTPDELTAHILANPQTYIDLIGNKMVQAKLLKSMN